MTIAAVPAANPDRTPKAIDDNRGKAGRLALAYLQSCSGLFGVVRGEAAKGFLMWQSGLAPGCVCSFRLTEHPAHLVNLRLLTRDNAFAQGLDLGVVDGRLLTHQDGRGMMRDH